MISPAPRSLAPNVAHSPIGPCAKIATLSPVRTLPLSAPEMPVEAISGSMKPRMVHAVDASERRGLVIVIASRQGALQQGRYVGRLMKPSRMRLRRRPSARPGRGLASEQIEGDHWAMLRAKPEPFWNETFGIHRMGETPWW